MMLFLTHNVCPGCPRRKHRDSQAEDISGQSANAKYLPVVRYIVAAMAQLGAFDAARTTMPLLIRLDRTLAATEAHLSE